MPKHEVVKLLRQMGQPVTLFAESDIERFKRYRLIS